MDEPRLTPAPPSEVSVTPTPSRGDTHPLREGTVYSVLSFLASGLNFCSQGLLSHFLRPGEFGTLNATFGIIGLFGVPLAIVNQSLSHFLASYDAEGDQDKGVQLRQAARSVLEMVAFNLGLISIFVIGIVESFFAFPRSTLWTFSTLAVGISLGATVSTAFQQGASRFRFWGSMLIIGASVRLIVGTLLAWWSPWAESGVFALIAANFVLFLPVLLRTDPPAAFDRWAAARVFLTPAFLKYAAACASVSLSLYLFSNSDQFVAQRWCSPPGGVFFSVIPWDTYDAYQAAGLLGRSLIWGSAPLVAIMYIHRSRASQSSQKTFQLSVLYGALVIFGAVTLHFLSPWLIYLFPGIKGQTILKFMPMFTFAMVPLAFLQFAGHFLLASRRFFECHLLGAFGLGYLVLLMETGRRPDLMLTFMFAGGSISFLTVFCVTLIRWSRARR